MYAYNRPIGSCHLAGRLSFTAAFFHQLAGTYRAKVCVNLVHGKWFFFFFPGSNEAGNIAQRYNISRGVGGCKKGKKERKKKGKRKRYIEIKERCRLLGLPDSSFISDRLASLGLLFFSVSFFFSLFLFLTFWF